MKTIKEFKQGCGIGFLISYHGISIRVLCGKKNTYDLGKTIISNGITYCPTCNELLFRIGEVLNLIEKKVNVYKNNNGDNEYSEKEVSEILQELKSKIEGK